MGDKWLSQILNGDTLYVCFYYLTITMTLSLIYRENIWVKKCTEYEVEAARPIVIVCAVD